MAGDAFLILDAMYKVLKAQTLLREFIYDEMAELLVRLGKDHYNAAIRVLQDMKLSNDPDKQIIIAVANLAASYEMFTKNIEHRHTWRRATLNILNPSYWIDTVRSEKFDKEDYWHSAHSAALISTCYAYLNENELVKKYSEMSLNSIVGYIEKS